MSLLALFSKFCDARDYLIGGAYCLPNEGSSVAYQRAFNLLSDNIGEETFFSCKDVIAAEAVYTAFTRNIGVVSFDEALEKTLRERGVEGDALDVLTTQNHMRAHHELNNIESKVRANSFGCDS